MAKHLTQTALARLKPGDYLADAVTPGLRVAAFRGRTSFVYRYRDLTSGKLRQVTIGDASKLTISEARDAVRDLKSARGEGEDPQAIRQRTVAAKVAETAHETYTVRALIDHYVTEHLDKTKRGGERERMLRQDLKKWYGREAAAVSRKDVKELVARIAKRAPDTAGRILRELRAAYRHALDHERIAVSVDPTTGVRAPKESRYVPRDRAFTVGEWKAWFKWLPKSGVSQDGQDALRLIALTAARPGEVTAAKWAEIDLENGTWAIRARKREGSHLVFLSRPALAILSRREQDGDYVFPSPTRQDHPVRQHALVWAVANSREGCPVPDWTAHDLRRSAATLLGELGYSTDLISRVLGHYSIRRPTDIYVRSTRDAEAKAAWARLGERLAELGKLQPTAASTQSRTKSA